jgi:hypothetical protein
VSWSGGGITSLQAETITMIASKGIAIMNFMLLIRKEALCIFWL